MIYTADTGTVERQRAIVAHGLGVLVTPRDNIWRAYRANVAGLALDNGAYRSWQLGQRPDFAQFRQRVERSRKLGTRWDFVVLPDIVAGGRESLEMSLLWSETDELRGLPLALAVQNGIRPDDVEPYLDRIKTIFVGGSLEWKVATASEWVRFAHENGKRCHIGRCGNIVRLRWARAIGADSVDSTTFTRRSKFHLTTSYLSEEQIEAFAREWR